MANDAAVGFESRAAAAFGGLPAPAGPGTWRVSSGQVFRAGKAADYSSDEEESAQQDASTRAALLPDGLLNFQGSHATCLPYLTQRQERSLDRNADLEISVIKAGLRGVQVRAQKRGS